jgi:multicomponent Na+:H+ antiporter subunit D
MSGQAPILIIAIPLFAALLLALGDGLRYAWVLSRRWMAKYSTLPLPAQPGRRLAYGLLVAALTGSLLAALAALGAVLDGGGEALRYRLGDWPPPIGIELVIDHLSGVVLVLVAGCALLTAIYSLHTAEQENPDRVHLYYALYALLVAGLLGMTATGDVFNLFVLLEISALSSYALLAMGRGPAYYATFKYLIVGTIGAGFYLLGVGYLYIKTGSLNMADLAEILVRPELQASESIRVGFILILIGIWTKMAFFPLHGWLPNAYTHASLTTSCLIAPLMTKVSVYVMIRLMFSVFSADYVFGVIPWGALVVGLASAAMLVGMISALAQRDLKKMLTYIIVAEIGYMVGGAWLANASGLTGAMYHILADALMTLCLFMAVGAIVYRTGDRSLAAMHRIFQRMPATAVVFLIGAASIIGVPPTCGFFSKWYLIQGGVQAEAWVFVAALLVSSLIAAILFFRLIEIALFGPSDAAPADGHGHGHDHDHAPSQPAVAMTEAPASMLAPMVLTAISLVVLGLYTNEVVTHFIRWALPEGW